MTAREYCKSHPVTAYDSSYGRCGGFQIHGDIEYGIDDYLYGMSGALCEDEKYHSYHHLKIIYALAAVASFGLMQILLESSSQPIIVI